MEATFHIRLGEPGLIVRYVPAEAIPPEPVTAIKGAKGDKGDQGDPGVPPEVPDLTLIFENQLI